MRTTFDLPDPLFRRATARAALDGVTLEDLVARYVEQGLQQGVPPPGGEEPPRRRSALPTIAKAATGTPIPALSSDELARIELEEDLARRGTPR